MRLAKLTCWSVVVALVLVACTRPDRTPPEVALLAPAAGAEIVIGTVVSVAGTASDAGGVASVAVFAGDEELGKVVPSADGEWALTWVPSEVGPVALSAIATDKAGNSESTPEVAVTVVSAPPTTGSIAGIVSRAGPDPDLEGGALAAAGVRGPARVVPGDILVRFAPSVQSALAVGGDALQAGSLGQLSLEASGAFTFGGAHFTLARTFPFTGGLGLYRVTDVSEDDTRVLAASLSRSPSVMEAFPNRILTTSAVPNDEFYEFQWHYEQLNLPEAWDIETGSSERVTVAVLDTGRFDHLDIEWAAGGANFAMWDGVEPLSSEGPISNFHTNPGGSDHGTHVAGTVGALTNNGVGVAGVNWNVDLLPVKVMTAAGYGTDAGIIEGLIWLTGLDDPAYGGWVNTNIPRVVNLSLGGQTIDGCPAVYELLFAHLASLGIYTVAAAGNEGAPTDHYGFGNCNGVITVGATGPTAMRAYYSNFGPYIDVMAPGGDFFATDPLDPSALDGVLSTIDGHDYDFMAGTSMAAPHVAGVISLMLAAEPDLSLQQIRTRLHNASVPLTADECNVKVLGFEGLDLCGAGLLDAAAALRGDVLTTPSAFVYALPYEDGTPPDLRASDLTSLELLARYKVEATANADGSFTYGLSGLEPGTYHVVALELRAPSSGISAIDRVGHHADVEVVAGEAAAADVTVVPLYTLR